MSRPATIAAGIALALALAAVGTPLRASAETRLALVIGSNRAPAGKARLRYAVRDARKMREVLVQLGRFPRAAITSLDDPGAAQLGTALATLRARGQGAAGRTVLLLYYSGHADRDALLLGDERFEIARIRQFLRDTGTALRVAIIDACQSGAVSQTKGGKKVAGYHIDWRREQQVRGSVLISSSTAEEASVESDDVGGSLFSHFLVSGLRGAADRDGDRRVTLEEAFRHAYHQTVERSAGTRAGLQHPTYEYRIAGQRQLVLSWPGQPAAATIRFGPRLVGSYLIFDRRHDEVVAELQKEPGVDRTLALPPGDYYVKKRLPRSLLLQKVSLKGASTHVLDERRMRTVAYEEDVTKGRLSPAFRPTWMYGAPPIEGTAHTLRRGEMLVGLWQPTSFGISDHVMLATSLLFTVLGSPNVQARFRLTDGPLIWSLQARYLHDFSDRLFDTGARSKIDVQVESLLSLPLGRLVTITASAGWLMRSRPSLIYFVPDPDGPGQLPVVKELEDHHLIGGLSLQLLLSEHDLIRVSGFATYPFEWGATAQVAHAWGTFRLGLGALYPSPLEGLVDFPVMPYVDLWWRW